MFAKETYIERRRVLKQSMGSGLLLFLGNTETGMNYADNIYPFRQDSTFLYYFASDYAGLAAIIDVDEDKEIIFGDELTIDDIVWTGVQPTIKEKCERVGISETMPMAQLATYLKKAQAKGQQIHFLPPYRGEHQVWLQELLGIVPAEQKATASMKFVKAVINQRNYKTAEEIEQIEEAIGVSVDMHCAAMRAVRPGVTEAQIAAIVRAEAAKHNFGLSFPIIATVNGQTLHNHAYGTTPLKEGQMFLLDSGCENAMHYAGDLTTTMPVGKQFTEQQRTVCNILRRAHLAAVEAIKPGVEFRNVHNIVLTEIAKGMVDLGLMKGNPEEAALAGAACMFLPHGLGHMMGLDVHDMENFGEVNVGYEEGRTKSTQFGFKSLRLAKALEPGFVFTVEPGIYFIPDLIDKWRAEKQFTDFICYDKLDTWRNFGGIRNEEDYLVFEGGSRRLGKYKPMSPEEIEAEHNK
ncbi:MAG: aminopeptidase P N-terminal domain-containing protein [Bacteroidaceae bacterium]|nr:aminopeptidase P N-terminal domain-containing protein [Bacteroidaceae bacterium]MBQ5818025.1 aminopeptidase P N-terminal domain-containing protein [Bacteroidaceae bacterium]